MDQSAMYINKKRDRSPEWRFEPGTELRLIPLQKYTFIYKHQTNNEKNHLFLQELALQYQKEVCHQEGSATRQRAMPQVRSIVCLHAGQAGTGLQVRKNEKPKVLWKAQFSLEFGKSKSD